MFVGQPAEEGNGGAKAMLADGLFTRFAKPDMGFALHVGPGPYGYMSYKPGVINSTADGLSVLFAGKGGHGSRPHVTIDPVMMAGRFIVDVQSVISREKDAAKFGVVTIGSVQAGNAGNVIPDTALLRGTIRSYDDDTRARMIEGVERTAASEDYSEFIMAGVPSFYFGIGGLDPKAVAEAAATHTQLPGNHSPEFAPVPEPTIRTGTQAMSLVLLDVLQKK
jgi:amidohydrolase